MGLRRAWIACVILAGGIRAGEVAPEMRAALDHAATKLGAPFHAMPYGFLASVTAGLETCERIDLEVRLGESAEVLAFPCLGGARVDVAGAADGEALRERLSAAPAGLSPFAWVAEGASPLRARCVVPADGGAALEEALRAVAVVDRATAGLLPALGLKPRLDEAEVTARLREAGTADEAGRNRILQQIASYLPELVPCAAAGGAVFVKHRMNARGAAFDAFRFRVPAEGGDRRLVWAFAYPPGTAKGWYVAPVAGEGPKFRKFHLAKHVESPDVPAGHAVIFQRSETPLRAGEEYILWFQFKVETPVEMHFALACLPFAASDKDGVAPLSEALGLKAK